MKEKEKGLNLPVIRKSGELTKQRINSLSNLDINRNLSMGSIMKKPGVSVQKDILTSEKGLDLVLVGDLTYSMTEYHKILKDKFIDLCGKLFHLIKNLRIGLIFYLDHDNLGSPGPDNLYITRIHKLTTNTEELINFIKTTSTGNGYDFDEAVEDALNDLVNNMNWKESNSRSVVLFGDASPHPLDDCPFNHDFFELVKELFKKDTTINSVFCNNYQQEILQRLENANVGDFHKRITYLEPANFFSWIANVTGGMVMGVENIEDLVDIILASAAKDSGNLDELEQKIKKASPKKLRLIEVARKAELRKTIGGNATKMLK